MTVSDEEIEGIVRGRNEEWLTGRVLSAAECRHHSVEKTEMWFSLHTVRLKEKNKSLFISGQL